jgi:hypothetical protein
LVGTALMAAVALLVFAVGPSSAWIEAIFAGCWLSVAGCALLKLTPRWRPTSLYLAAANVGLWAGAVTAVAGGAKDLAIALPFVLAWLPGRYIVERGWDIALKVIASWLTAVAILAMMVSLTPTPGYAPDHME